MAAESPRSAPRRSSAAKNGAGLLLSPRFRSAAELAGWDEESILLAALVVEDTPVRESRRKRRPSSAAATGSAGSNTRKRRSRRQSPGETPIPPVALVLDEDEKPNDHEVGKKEKEQGEKKAEEEEKVSSVEGKDKSKAEPAKEAAATTGDLPCMDRLREELSCAICLDICYQPSTTPCGHSFCMQCLKHAASKCGKRCPKCRQLISNSRSCTINTVLWNTIQLLFPSEVEARKSSMASGSASKDDVKQSPPRSNNVTTQGGMSSRNTGGNFTNYTRIGNTTRSSLAAGSRRSMQVPGSSMNSSSGSFDTQSRSTRSRDSGSGFVRASQLVATRSSARSGQSDDASLAYRLQQEEFMTAFDNEEGARQPQTTAVSSARANLRAMASRAERAVLLRARGWPL